MDGFLIQSQFHVFFEDKAEEGPSTISKSLFLQLVSFQAFVLLQPTFIFEKNEPEQMAINRSKLRGKLLGELWILVVLSWHS